MTPNNPLHNPFFNRFNDPVKRRRDEMQAHAYMVWLRERNEGMHRTPMQLSSAHRGHAGRVMAGVFTLLFIIVSVAVVFRGL